MPLGGAGFHSGITGPIRSWGSHLASGCNCFRLSYNLVLFIPPSSYVSCLSLLSVISVPSKEDPCNLSLSQDEQSPKEALSGFVFGKSSIKLRLGIPVIRTPCQVLQLGINLGPLCMSVCGLFNVIFSLVQLNEIHSDIKTVNVHKCDLTRIILIVPNGS